MFAVATKYLNELSRQRIGELRCAQNNFKVIATRFTNMNDMRLHGAVRLIHACVIRNRINDDNCALMRIKNLR